MDMEHKEKVNLLYEKLKDIINCRLDYVFIYYDKQEEYNERELLKLLYTFSNRYDVQLEIKYYSPTQNKIYLNESKINPVKLSFDDPYIVFNPELIKLLERECNCND